MIESINLNNVFNTYIYFKYVYYKHSIDRYSKKQKIQSVAHIHMTPRHLNNRVHEKKKGYTNSKEAKC